MARARVQRPFAYRAMRGTARTQPPLRYLRSTHYIPISEVAKIDLRSMGILIFTVGSSSAPTTVDTPSLPRPTESKNPDSASVSTPRTLFSFSPFPSNPVKVILKCGERTYPVWKLTLSQNPRIIELTTLPLLCAELIQGSQKTFPLFRVFWATLYKISYAPPSNIHHRNSPQ